MATQLLPPGPKGHFLTGSLRDYGKDPLGFLARCAREYGDVVRFSFPNTQVYFLGHPNHVDYVLVRNNRNFIKSKRQREQLRFLGQGLFTSEGAFWRRQRRLAQPAFHKERVAGYGRVMVDFAEAMVSTWQEGEVRDVHQEMMQLTLRIVATTLLGSEVEGETEKVGAALDVLARRFSGRKSYLIPTPSFLPTPANRRFYRAIRRLDDIVYSIILKRRAANGQTGDLLSMLMEARSEATGERMSDEQLRDEALTILLAGHETTAITLSWTFYLLCQDVEVDGKLLAELYNVLEGRAPTVDDLPRLRYADMVVKESMRLYPPAWGIGREAVGECEIGAFRVPAGTQLLMSPWVMHRDPRYFEEPETFYPDRWAGDATRGLPKYAYFPFGGGPRLCIGQSFAKIETVLLLGTIAQKFKFSLAEGQRIKPLPSITLRPDKGMRMVIEGR
jgi:cytochrome P450